MVFSVNSRGANCMNKEGMFFCVCGFLITLALLVATFVIWIQNHVTL